MGRRTHLERLALGRSLFEHVPDGATSPEFASEPVGEHAERDAEYVQQYDEKGRPINPTSEERNAALRSAQNAVLSLVGVVEINDAQDRESEWKYRLLRQAREHVLKDEEDRGTDMDVVAGLLHMTFTFWPESLLLQVQASLYSSSTSFAEIVLGELNSALQGGLKGTLTTLFRGAPAFVLYHSLSELFLYGALGECVDRLQVWIMRRFSRKKVKRFNTAVLFANEALIVGIEVALLPLRYFVEAQRLALAPAWPLVPGWRSFLPGYPTSIHSFIWTSAVGIPALAKVCSPAILILLQTCCGEGKEIPFVNHFIKFDYPPINAPPSAFAHYGRPAYKDPLGWFLRRGYVLRTGLMRWFGWNLEYIAAIPRAGKEYENNHVPPPASATRLEGETLSSGNEDDGLRHVYRSTSLVHLPPRFIAERIDSFFVRLLLLPFNGVVMRAVARSYMASPLPKAPLTANATTGYSSLLSQVSHNGGSWSEATSYLSKLGLSLALFSSAEILVFSILYRLCRWQGISNFDWGTSDVDKQGQINRLVYRRAGDRGLRMEG